MKLFKMLVLVGALTFSSGCQIDKAHFKYDEQAFKLVSPLALEQLKADLASGKITQEQFNDRAAAIAEWQRVIEDNVK